MHDEIVQTLRQAEREFGCRALYACESGSRARGFASPDSDYDMMRRWVGEGAVSAVRAGPDP